MDKIKESDNRSTPKWLFSLFEDWFDPCPLNPNPTIDGLLIDWKDKTFVNPPYSNPLKWVEKAIEENSKGKKIALLLRLDYTTKYFKALIDHGCHILYCSERLAFDSPSSDITYKSPFPSVLVIL